MNTTNSRHLLRKSLPHTLLAALLVLSLTLASALWNTSNLAFAVTSAEKQAEVDAALVRMDQLQTEINQLVIDHDAAVTAHAIAEANMLDAQAREEAARVRIDDLQEQLGDRASYMYRNGSSTYLDVLFGAQSFSEFMNVVDLINRVNEQNASLVAETKEVRAEAEAARIEYTEQELVWRTKGEEIGQILEGKMTAEANLLSEISALQQEAAELLAKEEAIAEAARQAAAAYASGPAGPVTDEQLRRISALGIGYPFASPQVISSHFGPRSFDFFHYGTDWACPTGTPVLAIAGGTVVAAGTAGPLGVYVKIAHGDEIMSIYMHNSSLAVSAGQAVSAGEVIALSGSTGNSTGPHLHLQIEVNRNPVNPMLFY
ncbi:MAG: peptidoglycan DD-metalloendopeptidase family protein [Coriobacteriia bacterium]|nr:peptidoglycan DD-metalloendopeptidase family protein [Coriobacteriia bacterium]